jgi:Glycosyl hydrolases family 16/Malectin domain
MLFDHEASGRAAGASTPAARRRKRRKPGAGIRPRARRWRGGVAVAVLVLAALVGLEAVFQGRGGLAPDVGVVRATANPATVTDAHGYTWAPRMTSSEGMRWSGGRTACSAGAVYGTATPSLYRCTLVGVRRVTLPVQRGTYAVTLFFAETLGAGPGGRIFDVQAEERPVATAIDVAASAGPRQAYHTVLRVPVTDGVLDVGFHPRVGQPILSAIAVTRLGQSASPPRLIWSDDFSGPAGSPPDPRRWTYDVGGGGWGNDELQTYTRSTANAALDGRGDLAITARRGVDGGPGGYTSARINTMGRFAFRYGTLEARIKVPAGRGLLPAFWALGANLPNAGWPSSGELDVMEVVGSEPSAVHGSAHGPGPRGRAYRHGGAATVSGSLDRGFHVYGVRWLPGAMQFALDGRPYATVVRADLPANQHWVFDDPFFILLNIAVGGDLPGSPDATTQFPETMLVDWIRVTR